VPYRGGSFFVAKSDAGGSRARDRHHCPISVLPPGRIAHIFGVRAQTADKAASRA